MTDQHTHEWQPADDRFECTQCEATTDPCNTCGRPLNTELTTCDRCLHNARRIITDITEAIDTIPFHHAEIMGLRAIRYDRPVITGSADSDRLPFGLDRIIEDPDDPRIEAAKHPNTAIDVLRDWATMWADTRGDQVDQWDDYLTSHTMWAAQNPDASGWHDYLTEARRVRGTIRRLLGLTAVKEAAPCVHCGGPVTRTWLNDGLDDMRKCEQCGTTWPDETRLAYANRHTVLALRATHPDMLVTIEEAKAILPEARRGTLDTWARRGVEKPERAKFPIRGKNVRGTPTYRLGDIADAWHSRELRPA